MFLKLLQFSKVVMLNHFKTKTFSIARQYSGRKFMFKSVGLAFVGLNVARCEDNPLVYNTDTLEHEFYIRQACTSNVTAAAQLLTVTIVAIQNTSERIREALSDEISLTRKTIEWGKMTPEEHFDELIELRSTLDDLKHNLQTLTSYMEFAERLATLSAEIAFISGNVGASDILCNQIHQVGQAYRAEVEKNEMLQMESLGWQQVAIESAKKKEILKSDDKIENNVEVA